MQHRLRCFEELTRPRILPEIYPDSYYGTVPRQPKRKLGNVKSADVIAFVLKKSLEPRGNGLSR